MGRYALRRLLQTIPILFGVSILIFLFVRAIPGDPAVILAGPDATAQDVTILRERLGLDRSLPEQYGIFIWGLLRGDLGNSLRTGAPVTQEIGLRLGPTLELAATAIGIAIVVGLMAGVVSAVYRNTWVDYTTMVGAMMGISFPSFWLGLMLMSLFAVQLRWLPSSGRTTGASLVLPAVTLGLSAAASIARFTRASMLQVLHSDFIRTARAKGVTELGVNLRHALGNALIPVITVVGLQFGFLLGGSVVVESVFSWPGVGRLLVDAIGMRDYPVIQALMLLFSLQFMLISLLVDLAYGLADPRVRYE